MLIGVSSGGLPRRLVLRAVWKLALRLVLRPSRLTRELRSML